MAIVYSDSAGVLAGWRWNEAQEVEFPIPEDARDVVEFDIETNAQLVEFLNTDWNNLRFANGNLEYRGVIVTIQPDGAELAERKAVRNAIQNFQAYRDLASPTGAQTVAVVKMLCRVVTWLLVRALRN